MPDATVDEVLLDPSLRLSTLDQIRRDPLVLSGLFVEVTRNFYLNEKNLYPNAKTWSPTNEKDHVFIEPSHLWEDGDVSRRPAIFY